MKLWRSSEHRRSNPTILACAGVRAPLGQRRGAPGVRDGCLRCAHPLPGIAKLALVGALLLSFTAGIPSAGAAQAPSSGSTGETSAAFSSVEKLKLTLALARSYRLTGEPQRALDTLAPLSAGPWPSSKRSAHDEVARDEDALGRPRQARGELETTVALDPTAERRFRLGQLAERLGDPDEAQRQLEAAVAAEPENTEYKAALTYMLRNSGDLAGAAQLLSGVLAAAPKSLCAP